MKPPESPSEQGVREADPRAQNRETTLRTAHSSQLEAESSPQKEINSTSQVSLTVPTNAAVTQCNDQAPEAQKEKALIHLQPHFLHLSNM